MKYIVTIRNHKQFGILLIPCMIGDSPNREFHTVRETLTPDSIHVNPDRYTDAQKKIIKLADEYTETRIRKEFGSSRYQNNATFIHQLAPSYIAESIRPYIDKRVSQIVDLCIESGIRIYIKQENLSSIFPDDEVTISQRKAKAVFNFQRLSDETRYFLTIQYHGRDISILRMAFSVLSHTPCILLMGNTMIRIDDIDAKKIMPFVEKEYVSVAKRMESTYYEKFVKGVIESGYETRVQGFRISTPRLSPKAILSMESDIAGGLLFSIKFRYGDVDFQPASPQRIVAKFIDHDGEYSFMKISRDMQYEADTEAEAGKIFGQCVSKGYYKVPNLENNDKLLMRSIGVNFLNANKERLTEAGIEIELSEADKKYYTGSISLDLKVNKREDWFDIYAMVRLDDVEVPFIALKHYILNNIREFTLPDGRIVVLPEEWFEQYHDLFASGAVNKKANTIELRNYQYSALDNLPLEVDLRERIEKLKHSMQELTHLPNRQPQNVNATLRPYQVTAFNWMKMMRDYGFGAVLADDMGLGKTLCTLSLLSESMATDGEFQDGMFSYAKKIPSLLLVPKSLIYNWINEARKFVPQMRILEFTGGNRLDSIKSFPLYDIVIAGYGTLRLDIDELQKVRFNYVILDESQMVKNSSSKTYQSIMMLDCNHRLALTGTPLENSLTDLWSQMNFINPGILGNLQSFKKRFVNPIEKNANEEASERLRKTIYPFILRRTKQQVLQDLPEMMEQTVLCDMTEKQKEIYEKEKSLTRNSILEIMDRGTFEKSTVMVLQSLTRLRQISCSPSLTMEDYDGGSGKTDTVIESLNTIISQGHKVLIFSSFVRHLELIARRLEKQDTSYAILTGATEKRESEVRKFMEPNIPVFLISIKAGGTGLNLTQADYVFIIDPWWNPAVEDQAIARAHRMGQKNAVMVYRFISKDTVEEKIQKLQRKKADLASAFVSENTEFTPDLKSEVLRMLE